MARNSGDKTDGAKSLRSGKDKGDPAGANRRPISTMGRQTGRNITSQGKDVKLDDNVTPLPENRGKSKTKATITSFLAGETQESGTTLINPTSGEGQTATESSPVGALSEKTLKETAAQPGGGGLVGSDSCATDIVAGQNISQSPGGRDQETEKEMKILDWAKDSGDKFYSLTEESDFRSADEHSPSKSGSNTSSERGNASSSNEPTVRQRRRQQTRIESRRARVATKRLQGAVLKVAKSCTEIEAKLGTMDERIVAVEEDVDMLKQQNAMQEGQLTDIMWKLEDFENRQRRNNLLLGIKEGLEGNDIRAYMIKLLQGAFPELNHRDWDNEIQRVRLTPPFTAAGITFMPLFAALCHTLRIIKDTFHMQI
ncbi:hypothetical protein NDU88_009879 [Pleurodeles waltl]|uniref:Uncharacterized protein n=1 Tax=Pleurodeles waltl TaxID=8319 RepID=A0AAV7QVS7_PLEWA|nr:hypothetical protein NDU88_009879 [Pleurodeles waltl]